VFLAPGLVSLLFDFFQSTTGRRLNFFILRLQVKLGFIDVESLSILTGSQSLIGLNQRLLLRLYHLSLARPDLRFRHRPGLFGFDN